MSDINPDLAAQEVDEDLRRDQLIALWKSYGKFIIAGAVGIALVVASNELYTAKIKSDEEANALAFDQAVEKSQSDGADVVTVWAETLPSLEGGYQTLAGLRLAQAKAASGDIDGAISSYDNISKQSGVDDALQDLAQFAAATLVGKDPIRQAEAISRLSVVAIKGKAWYFSAMEQLAFLTMKSGDSDTALSHFSILADDPETPPQIKTRAAQFRQMIEGKMSAPMKEPAPADAINNEGDSSES
ncbi:tetratricopeptide repeat protein [Kordiimonas pumila]|uniref:Tetratricopeptide repeat protein n=1 Tax=Kordiimonas pumila TaxID=2161677 RepID=A0ABV7D277_9PROT|nr:tetratricopeptide repeat protein [Kordiimonas pumila]